MVYSENKSLFVGQLPTAELYKSNRNGGGSSGDQPFLIDNGKGVTGLRSQCTLPLGGISWVLETPKQDNYT